MKIAIIANCQAGPLSQALILSSPDIEKISFIQVHLINSPIMKGIVANFKNFIKNEADIILTFPLSDRFSEFSTNILKKELNNVYTITNIHFTGIFPDVTYLGTMGNRIKSPIGDYHSRIILDSFLKNLSVKECINRFNYNEYKNLGFFDVWDISVSRLKNKEVDFNFATKFLDMIKSNLSLFTINHPTNVVFIEYAKFLCDCLYLDKINISPQHLVNQLSNGAWWPIYPEIASYHNLLYETPFKFKKRVSNFDNLLEGGLYLSLEEFVEESYILYSKNSHKIKEELKGKSLFSW